MTEFDATAALALAEQCERDDKAMTAGEWRFGYATIRKSLRPDDEYEAQEEDDGPPARLRVALRTESIARTRNALPQIAAMLKAGMEEVERLRLYEFHTQNSCLDCEGPLVQCDCQPDCPGGKCARKCWERDSARAEVERLRPVYEAAIAWRDTGSESGSVHFAATSRLVSAIDAALTTKPGASDGE